MLMLFLSLYLALPSIILKDLRLLDKDVSSSPLMRSYLCRLVYIIVRAIVVTVVLLVHPPPPNKTDTSALKIGL